MDFEAFNIDIDAVVFAIVFPFRYEAQAFIVCIAITTDGVYFVLLEGDNITAVVIVAFRSDIRIGYDEGWSRGVFGFF